MVISTGVLAWIFSSIKFQAKLGAALGSLIAYQYAGCPLFASDLYKHTQTEFYFSQKSLVTSNQ